MDTLDQPVCHSLQLQLSLLDALAQSLNESQAALLAADLAGFEAHTRQQWQLCQALQREKIGPAPVSRDAETRSGQSSHSVHSAQRLDLESQVRIMENRVRQLNRVHACLLRRAQKSLAVFRHILASQSATYVAGSESSECKEGGG